MKGGAVAWRPWRHRGARAYGGVKRRIMAKISAAWRNQAGGGAAKIASDIARAAARGIAIFLMYRRAGGVNIGCSANNQHIGKRNESSG